MAGKKQEERIRCSFCGKPQEQVRKLIAGPNGIYICESCVDVCAEIIEEEWKYLRCWMIMSLDKMRLRRYCLLLYTIIIREFFHRKIWM